MTPFISEFKKLENEDQKKLSTLYLATKSEKIINERDIDNLIKTIYCTIKSNIQKSFGQV